MLQYNSMSCYFFLLSKYLQRFDKNNANTVSIMGAMLSIVGAFLSIVGATLSIIGAFLTIIGPLSENLRIAL